MVTGIIINSYLVSWLQIRNVSSSPADFDEQSKGPCIISHNYATYLLIDVVELPVLCIMFVKYLTTERGFFSINSRHMRVQKRVGRDLFSIWCKVA